MHLNTITMGAIRSFKMPFLVFHMYTDLFQLFYILFLLVFSCIYVILSKFAGQPKETKSLKPSLLCTSYSRRPNFPKPPILLTQARPKKYLKVKDFKVVKAGEFYVNNIEGYEELLIMLEERVWLRLNA